MRAAQLSQTKINKFQHISTVAQCVEQALLQAELPDWAPHVGSPKQGSVKREV